MAKTKDYEPPDCHVGRVLEKIRGAHDWTMSAFARRCVELGVPRVDASQLRKYYAGWRHMPYGRVPDHDQIERFAKAFPEHAEAFRRARKDDVAEREQHNQEEARERERGRKVAEPPAKYAVGEQPKAILDALAIAKALQADAELLDEWMKHGERLRQLVVFKGAGARHGHNASDPDER